MADDEIGEKLAKVNEFICEIDILLDKNESEEALNRVLDSDSDDLVKPACLDIIQLVGRRISINLSSENGDDDETHDERSHLEAIFEYLLQIGDPKECLIGILNLLEQARSTAFLIFLLEPLQITLVRLPTKRGETLRWALNLVYGCIRNIPLPDHLRRMEEEKEKRLLENCPEINALENCVASTLAFCRPFLSEAKACKMIESTQRRREQAAILSAFLLKVLERPVIYFDRSANRSVADYNCASAIVGMLLDLNWNFLLVGLDWLESSGGLTLECTYVDDDNDNKRAKRVDRSVFGLLASMIFCDGICSTRMPVVHRHEFYFERLLSSIVAMFRSRESINEQLPIAGLRLLEYFADLISLLRDGETGWEAERLGLREYQGLFLGLINAMVYLKSEKWRRKSVDLFKTFINFFHCSAQLIIIRMIFNFVGKEDNASEGCNAPNNSKTDIANKENKGDLVNQPDVEKEWHFNNYGIRGYLIDFYRGRLNDDTSVINKPYFDSLPAMMGLFTKIEGSNETDFLAYFDQYMATLNLIRFICLRYQNGKMYCTESLLQSLSTKFIEQIRRSLQLARAHYDHDIKTMKEDQAAATSAVEKAAHTERISVLASALNCFDLLTSLIVRVDELLNECLTRSQLA